MSTTTTADRDGSKVSGIQTRRGVEPKDTWAADARARVRAKTSPQEREDGVEGEGEVGSWVANGDDTAPTVVGRLDRRRRPGHCSDERRSLPSLRTTSKRPPSDAGKINLGGLKGARSVLRLVAYSEHFLDRPLKAS
jgi:hypothetical protein